MLAGGARAVPTTPPVPQPTPSVQGGIGPAAAATLPAASSTLPVSPPDLPAGLAPAGPPQPLLAPQDGRPPAPAAVASADRTRTAPPLPAGTGDADPDRKQARGDTAPSSAPTGAIVTRSTTSPLATVPTQSTAAPPEAVASALASDAKAPSAPSAPSLQASAPANLADPPPGPGARSAPGPRDRAVTASGPEARRAHPAVLASASSSHRAAADEPASDQAWLEPGAEAAEGAVTRVEHAAPDPTRAQAPGRPTPPAPVVQIGVHIARAVPARIDRLFVQLEPAALGRVEVRLRFHRDDQVSAVIAAERPDTLDALQRDARLLERSLHQAGLRLDSDGLTFSLKREQAHHQPHEDGWLAPSANGIADQPVPTAHDQAPPLHWFQGLRALDIRV
jgi:hypothetical protein